jgi:hypothetical protein
LTCVRLLVIDLAVGPGPDPPFESTIGHRRSSPEWQVKVRRAGVRRAEVRPALEVAR